eukprot:3560344-Pleurochrysis_carterae.AAC.1
MIQVACIIQVVCTVQVGCTALAAFPNAAVLWTRGWVMRGREQPCKVETGPRETGQRAEHRTLAW